MAGEESDEGRGGGMGAERRSKERGARSEEERERESEREEEGVRRWRCERSPVEDMIRDLDIS